MIKRVPFSQEKEALAPQTLNFKRSRKAFNKSNKQQNPKSSSEE